jgi:hypothetical protein
MKKTRHGENKNKSINNIFVFELGGLVLVRNDTKIDHRKRRNIGVN